MSLLRRFAAGRWVLVLVVGLSLSEACRAEAAPNLMDLGGFKAGPGDLSQALKASCEGGKGLIAKFYLTQKERSTGNGVSLCIERLAPQGNARVIIAEAISVKPGGRYYFSCMAKCTERAVEVFMNTQPNPPAGEKVPALKDAVTHTLGAYLIGDGHRLLLPQSTARLPDGFNRLETAFTVPDGVKSLSITVGYSHASGAAWFDDFALYSLD